MIAELDALFNLIIIILSLGLLSTSVREIALSQNWKLPFIEAQKARFTLSLALIAGAALGFKDPYYFLLASAPVFALHGDYALYGKGFPVLASLLAFGRVFISSAALYLSALFWPNHIVNIFAITTVTSYLISGIVISYKLSTPYFITPSRKSLLLYFNTLYLGVVAFGYYFLGLGLIIPGSYFYTESVVVLSYILLKIFVIYKGVLRIIVQAFINEMQDDRICIKVDHLASLAGFAFLMSTTIFPATFLNLLVDKSLENDFISVYLIGIIGFLISPFISFTSKAMLEKKDKSYAVLSAIAILSASACCIILSFFAETEKSILVSLAIGELISVVGLIVLLSKRNVIMPRISFILKNLPFLLIPFSLRFIFGDTLYAFISFLIIYIVLALLTNRNQFKKNIIPI